MTTENGWARINGVFWAAFLLFSWTAASIVSGSVIERIRSGAFWILAVAIGSVFWIIDAAWGWHSGGLDGPFSSATTTRTPRGSSTPSRAGSRSASWWSSGHGSGSSRPTEPRATSIPRNPWLVAIGLFLIYTGFWGFYVACNIPIMGRPGG